jgi:drug/metabolite transporter (DMT)-like permease
VVAEAVAAREPSRAGSHPLSGPGLVLLAATTYGTMPVLGRVAYDAGADIYTFLALRFIAAAAILWIWVIARGLPLPRGRLLAQVIAIGAVLYFAQSLTFFESVKHADISIVAAIAYTYPIALMVLTALTGRDELAPVKVLAALGAVAGAVMVVGAGGHAEVIGIVLVMTANILYAFYLTITEWVIPPGYATSAGVVIVTAAGFSFASAVAVGPGFHPPAGFEGWAAVVGVTLGPTVIGVIALIAGLQRIKPVATATLAALEPVVAVILAVLLLDEAVSPLQVAGFLLVIVCVVIVARLTTVAARPVKPAAER